MNKVLATLVLALTTTAVLAQGIKSSQAQPAQDQPTNKKQIDDQVEYNVYIAALNTQDPAKRAEAMIAFVSQYPKSVVRIDALEQAMGAYQAANNPTKVAEAARAILQENPDAIRARAIVTAIDRSQAAIGDTQALNESCESAQKGLRALPAWPKPEDMAKQNFEELKIQMGGIFLGAAGFCALQRKAYEDARQFYLLAVQADPGNLQDVYQLTIAELEGNPIELDGFWYGAKAINLAGGNAEARDGIIAYVKTKYKNYTGSYEGWDQMVAAAATQAAPPANIAASIKPKKTPCDVAVDAVNSNDPSSLSFSDMEFILAHAACSPANKEAADKVWQTMLAKQKDGDADVKLKLPVLVISATRDTIQAALTEENQKDKKADLTINLGKPVLHPPAAGSTVEVVGVLSNYTPDPFMFIMEKGSLLAAKPGSGARKTVGHAQAGRKRKA